MWNDYKIIKQGGGAVLNINLVKWIRKGQEKNLTHSHQYTIKIDT